MNSLKEYSMGMDFTVKTFAGLEQALFDELKELGAQDLEIIKRGVTFRGDMAMMYKVNYLSRLAIRVLKPIGVFEVLDEKQLYDKVKSINWADFFRVTQTFSVESNVFYSNLDHSHYVSLKTKDAIVDQFRETGGKRPWVSLENPEIYIDVHISQNVCTVSLDSSGESLHKRGYRISTDKAPINEVLAAGILNISGWDCKKDLYDPMCGSGTIPIEAAMLAMHVPAGYYRKSFAFMNWEGFDEEVWNAIKAEADAEISDMECEIYASDRSDKAVGIARRNFRSAGMHKDINIKQSYFDAVVPERKNGIIMMNPPYGIRLEERGELRDLYRGIGDVLKNAFVGFEAWIISPSFDSTKFIGLRPSKRITLFNGPLESRLMLFEVYEGSRRYGENNDGDERWKERNSRKRDDYQKRDNYDKKDSYRGRDDFKKRDDFDKKEGYKRRDDFDKKDGYKRRDDFKKRDDFDKKDGYKPREDYKRKGDYDSDRSFDKRKKYDNDRPERRDKDDSRSGYNMRELEDRSKNFERHLESIRRFSKPDHKKDTGKGKRKRINKKPPEGDEK